MEPGFARQRAPYEVSQTACEAWDARSERRELAVRPSLSAALVAQSVAQPAGFGTGIPEPTGGLEPPTPSLRGRSGAETGRCVTPRASPFCLHSDWIGRSVTSWIGSPDLRLMYPSGTSHRGRGAFAERLIAPAARLGSRRLRPVVLCGSELPAASRPKQHSPRRGNRWPRACDVFVQPATLVLRSAWAIRSKSCHLPGRPVPSSDPQRPTASMTPLQVIKLGDHRVVNPQPGEPPFLSAASGTAWSGTRLYSVGDDQASVAEYVLQPAEVQEALSPGDGRRRPAGAGPRRADHSRRAPDRPQGAGLGQGRLRGAHPRAAHATSRRSPTRPATRSCAAFPTGC